MPGRGRGGDRGQGRPRGGRGGSFRGNGGSNFKNNLWNTTGRVPGQSDQGNRNAFTPVMHNKRDANVISPLDGVLPKTRNIFDRERKMSTLNQLLEPIDTNNGQIGSLTAKLLRASAGDNGCDTSYHDHNKPPQGDQNVASVNTTGTAAAAESTGTAPPDGAAAQVDLNAPLTVGLLRHELAAQHKLMLRAVHQHTADILQEQLTLRDHLTTSMASKINVHGAALMELTSVMSELNSNKGGTHLKTRVDRLERQIVDYSFLLEGLERNDDYPLELLVLHLIQEKFGFDIQARDIDLAIRFGSSGNEAPKWF